MEESKKYTGLSVAPRTKKTDHFNPPLSVESTKVGTMPLYKVSPWAEKVATCSQPGSRRLAALAAKSSMRRKISYCFTKVSRATAFFHLILACFPWSPATSVMETIWGVYGVILKFINTE